MDQSLENRIRERAYEIWAAHGFCGQLYWRGKNHQRLRQATASSGLSRCQRVRSTLGAAVSVTVNPADKGALRWCTSDATVAFTGPGPSSPVAGIGGMSASPAGSSKRGDYP
jgi:hypothetical protein